VSEPLVSYRIFAIRYHVCPNASNGQNEAYRHSRLASRGDLKINDSDPFDFMEALNGNYTSGNSY
jgi:hypothetical protein